MQNLQLIPMAGYVENHLIKDENIVHHTNYHWINYINLKGILSLGIIPMIQRRTSEFVITNKRIVVKTGLIARDTVEMNLSRIETVNVDQSFFGRIFNYGTITIVGTGGTKEEFHNIQDPITFRKRFQEYVG